MNILYSFTKTGFEADYWAREIANASSSTSTFIPFNHAGYLNPNRYIRAQLLDNLYYERNRGLMHMYRDLQEQVTERKIDVLIVDTCHPYHPDFLKTLGVYKVLRTADGPMAAYDRDFAYLHAYDHVVYHSPAYSRDMGMEEKLIYCGAKRVDFWPLGSFDALCDPLKTEEEVLNNKRDIDIVFVGALHLNKMEMIAKLKKEFRRRFRVYGLSSTKRNLYFNLRYCFPGWIRALPFERYVPLYQRAKIGINIHNRGDYTVGGYRLFDLPANGVMQISDGGRYLNSFFNVGVEVESYSGASDLIEKVNFYLSHDVEREQIAANGLRRVRQDYRIERLLSELSHLIGRAIGAG